MVHKFSSFLNEAEIKDKKPKPSFKIGDNVHIFGEIDYDAFDGNNGEITIIGKGTVMTNMGSKGLKKYGKYTGILYYIERFDVWSPPWNLVRDDETELDWEGMEDEKPITKKSKKKSDKEKDSGEYIYLKEISDRNKNKKGKVNVKKVLLELKELLKDKEFIVQCQENNKWVDMNKTMYDFEDLYIETDKNANTYVDSSEGICISGEIEVIYWTDRLKLFKAEPKPPKPESKPLDQNDANWWFTNSEKKPVNK